MIYFDDFRDSVEYERTSWFKSWMKSKPEKISLKQIEQEKNPLLSKKEKKIIKNNNKNNRRKGEINNSQNPKTKNQYN